MRRRFPLVFDPYSVDKVAEEGIPHQRGIRRSTPCTNGERDRSESRLVENESVHFNSYYQGTMRRAVEPCSSRRLSRPASGPFAASIGGCCRFH